MFIVIGISLPYLMTIADFFGSFFFVDFLWVILLKTKAEVSTHVKKFITMIQNQFHITPKHIRLDSGHEFLLHELYASLGIVH